MGDLREREMHVFPSIILAKVIFSNIAASSLQPGRQSFFIVRAGGERYRFLTSALPFFYGTIRQCQQQKKERKNKQINHLSQQ